MMVSDPFHGEWNVLIHLSAHDRAQDRRPADVGPRFQKFTFLGTGVQYFRTPVSKLTNFWKLTYCISWTLFSKTFVIWKVTPMKYRTTIPKM